jgi:hypothetical protein
MAARPDLQSASKKRVGAVPVFRRPATLRRPTSALPANMNFEQLARRRRNARRDHARHRLVGR